MRATLNPSFHGPQDSWCAPFRLGAGREARCKTGRRCRGRRPRPGARSCSSTSALERAMPRALSARLSPPGFAAIGPRRDRAEEVAFGLQEAELH